jgi:glycyl-tRNA synthetase beta subunit
MIWIMCDDKELRENRLALLQAIIVLAEGIVDLSYLEGF